MLTEVFLELPLRDRVIRFVAFLLDLLVTCLITRFTHRVPRSEEVHGNPLPVTFHLARTSLLNELILAFHA